MDGTEGACLPDLHSFEPRYFIIFREAIIQCRVFLVAVHFCRVPVVLDGAVGFFTFSPFSDLSFFLFFIANLVFKS